MAAPNIVNVGTIVAKTTYVTPASNTANLALANAVASNKVFKINMIFAANIDTSNTVNTSVAINSNAAGSGTSFPLAANIAVPSGATLIISDKSTAFYLEEDRSILVTSGTASKITYTISYEEIS